MVVSLDGSSEHNAAGPVEHPVPGGRIFRLVALAFHRITRSAGLTLRFLIIATLVVALAMAVVGGVVSQTVKASITDGVARTAAASLDSLIAHSVRDIFAGGRLTDQDKQRLDGLFEIGNDATMTRLIQIRIFRLDGQLLYEASPDVVDTTSNDRFDAAKKGGVSGEVVELPLEGTADGLGAHPIQLLRLYAPLHEPQSGNLFAVAALYFSTRTLVSIQDSAQIAVWTIVLFVGLLVIALLYSFVATADRRAGLQAARLAANLAESRRLSEEVRGLHAASEQLRVDAIDANEQLLARVGSDIHDGPLQLMTLAILQLTRAVKANQTGSISDLQPTVDLTTEAMTDLRNISAGLVLPELAGLTLARTIELAVQRHRGLTGTNVETTISDLDFVAVADVQTSIYRVIQESLSNAFRHSNGSRPLLNAYRAADGSVRLEISNPRVDSAVPEEASPARPHLGLRGMRLRLEAVGGTLGVEMRESQIVVRVVVPEVPRPSPLARS